MMPAAATPSRDRQPRPARRGAVSVADSARADLALGALRLLGRWQRVSSGHLWFTNGCACGIGATVDLADLDDLVLDYLKRKFAALPATAALLAAHEMPGGMKSLLRAVVTGATSLPPVALGELLAAIESSVASIEEQHAAR